MEEKIPKGFLTIGAYAKYVGIPQNAVHKAVEAGKIPCLRSGTRRYIDPIKANECFAYRLNQEPETKAEPAEDSPDKPKFTLTDARTQKEGINARLKHIQLQKELGKTVEVEKVRLAWFEISRTVRNAYLGLPDRIAPILASITDPVEVHRVLYAEIVKILENLIHENRI